MTAATARDYAWSIAAALPIWLACSACAFVFTFTQIRPLRPERLGAICAALRATDRIQVGIAWASPESVNNAVMSPLVEVPRDVPDYRRGWLWLTVAGVAAALCVGLFGLAWALQSAQMRKAVPVEYTVNVCAGVYTAGRFEARVEWAAPFVGNRLPLRSVWPRTVCGTGRWLPILPAKDWLAFPPKW